MHHAQRVFQKSSGKAVMYGLGGRMSFKAADKRLVFHKEIFQQLPEMDVGDLPDIRQQLLIHSVYTLIGCRHIIRRIVLSLISPPDLPDNAP